MVVSTSGTAAAYLATPMPLSSVAPRKRGGFLALVMIETAMFLTNEILHLVESTEYISDPESLGSRPACNELIFRFISLVGMRSDKFVIPEMILSVLGLLSSVRSLPGGDLL